MFREEESGGEEEATFSTPTSEHLLSATVCYGRNIVEAERGDTDDWQKRSISFSMGARVSLAILKERRRKEAKRKKVITESKADSRLIIIMGKKNENEERGKKKNQSRPFAEERIQ